MIIFVCISGLLKISNRMHVKELCKIQFISAVIRNLKHEDQEPVIIHSKYKHTTDDKVLSVTFKVKQYYSLLINLKKAIIKTQLSFISFKLHKNMFLRLQNVFQKYKT